MDAIDWRAAQWIGERVAGSPPRGEVQTGSVQPLADEFAQRVSAYSGLVAPPELPALETVDRPAWMTFAARSGIVQDPASPPTMSPVMNPQKAPETNRSGLRSTWVACTRVRAMPGPVHAARAATRSETAAAAPARTAVAARVVAVARVSGVRLYFTLTISSKNIG